MSEQQVKQAKAKEQAQATHQLASAICAIMADLSEMALGKTGHNMHFDFDYVTIDDLNRFFQPVLARHGVAFLPTIEEVKTEGKLTTIKCAMNLIHAPSGTAITATWYGQGIDSGDKAIYKAIAGACKYFLLRVFCVGSGNDADSDSCDDNGGPSLASEAQLAEMAALVEAKGRTWQHFQDHVKKQTKGLLPQELPAEKADGFIRWLKEIPAKNAETKVEVSEKTSV